MRFRAILYHGADECWGKSGDDLLALLSQSTWAMAKERQERNWPCDGGVIFDNGVEIYRLSMEHWTKV